MIFKCDSETLWIVFEGLIDARSSVLFVFVTVMPQHMVEYIIIIIDND